MSGVKIVVEKLKMNFGGAGKKTDNDINTEAVNRFKRDFEVPNDKAKMRKE